MKFGKKPPNMGKKGAVVGMVICFVAMIAVASVYTSGRMQNVKDDAAEEDQISDQAKATGADDIKNDTKEKEEDNNAAPGKIAGNTDVDDTESSEETDQQTANSGTSVTFSKDESMKWPISGGVILGYSMDRTVYFKTLDQYKCNPAMIIDGEEGEQVVAAADGVVLNVTEDSETGKTLVLDMGNEYRAIYGQLTDIKYSAGQHVNQGDVVGKLAKPSKYYTEEGPNLFFKVTKDGVPVDPTQFLE